MFKKLILVILIVGIGLIIAGFAITGGNFKDIRAAFLADDDYTQMRKEGIEVFNNADIELADHDVYFYYSSDDSYLIEYFESDYDKVNISVENNKLIIKNTNKTFNKIFNWKFKSDKVSRTNIYLPKGFNGNLKTKVTSGIILIDGFSLNEGNFKLTSGNLTVKNTDILTSLSANITSGDAYITNVKADSLTVDASSGTVKILSSQISNKINIDVTSGDIRVKETSSKLIDVEATSGRIYLEKVEVEGVNAEVTSGDIYMTLIGLDTDYRVEIDITSGTFYYLGEKTKSELINKNASKLISIDVTSGSARLSFVN